MHIDGFHQLTGVAVKGSLVNPWRLEQFGYKGTVAAAASSGQFPIQIDSGSEAATITRDAPWTGDEVSFGVHVRCTALTVNKVTSSGRGNLVAFEIAGRRFHVWQNRTDNTLYLGRKKGNIRPIYSTPYFYEVSISRARREIKVFVNGRLDIVDQLPDEVAGSRSITVVLGWLPQAEYQPDPEPMDMRRLQYGSFYVKEGERLGPVSVTSRPPSAAALADWTNWSIGGVLIGPSSVDGLKSKDSIIGTKAGARATYLSNTRLPQRLAKVRVVKLGLFAKKHRKSPVTLGTVIGTKDGTLGEIKQLHPNVGADWTLVEMTKLVDGIDPKAIFDAPFGLTLE